MVEDGGSDNNKYSGKSDISENSITTITSNARERYLPLFFLLLKTRIKAGFLNTTASTVTLQQGKRAKEKEIKKAKKIFCCALWTWPQTPPESVVNQPR